MDEKEILKLIEQSTKKKKKGSFSKKIVIFVIFLNIVFTSVVFYSFLKVQAEPSALIVAWFSFTTVELFSLASIKKQEIKEGEE